MAHRIRHISVGMIGLAILLSGTSGADARKAQAPGNRSVDSVHQPIVTRTDFVLDLATGPAGLAPGEKEHLTGWFEGLGISYGDTITVDPSTVWKGAAAQDGVSAVASRYGMLISHDAPPATVGRPAPGALRVVVSRSMAHVDGCPDWSRGNGPEYGGASESNYGCATAVNLAAMAAKPEDLVEGQASDRGFDAALSVKAIKTYKDNASTGAANVLKSESTGSH